MRVDLAVDFADALEVAQVVQTAGRNGGVERAELLGQPAHLEEVGLMQFEALSVLRDEVSCAIQHRLGAILRNARRVRIPVEDEHAHWPVAGTDIQDGDGCVVGEWEEVADQLKPLGSARVLSLLPPHPLVHVRLRGPIVVVVPRPIASCAASLTRPHLGALPRTARPESCGNRSANATRGSRTGSGLPPLNLAQPPLEKSALGVIGDQREGSRIALRRFLRGSETAQQIGARGMQQMITVELRSEEHTSELQSL